MKLFLYATLRTILAAAKEMRWVNFRPKLEKRAERKLRRLRWFLFALRRPQAAFFKKQKVKASLRKP